MESIEIEQLKDTVAEESKENPNPVLEEDAIYVLSESEGWRLLMKKCNKTILQLLEPIDASDITAETNLALIGANTIANAKALRVLREFVGEVEAIKNARRAVLKKQTEESKPEA